MQLSRQRLSALRHPHRSRFTSVLSSIWIAAIASFAEASRLFRKMTSKGLPGLPWRRALPVPVLTVVMEVTVLRDMELELVVQLGAWCLELVADERLLRRLCVILPRLLPSVIDSMAVLTGARLLRAGLCAALGIREVEVEEALKGCGNHN
jgi:hypothetical protein